MDLLYSYIPKWVQSAKALRSYDKWRNQGFPGWANRPPGRPKWGRKWRNFEEKWENLQENEERLRKCSYLAHPGVRGWLRPWLWRHKNMPDLKIAIFCEKYAKIQNFAIKVLNIRISPGVLLIQKENGNSNMFCKFQYHSMQIFFKMANFKYLKLKKVASTPSPSDFDGLPYPG